MRYRVCLLVFIVLWAIPSSAHASTWMKKPFFAIEVPEGWSEIPGEILDRMMEAKKGAVEGMAGKRIDFGFQLSGKTDEISLPFVFVLVEHSGKIKEYDEKDAMNIPYKQGVEEGLKRTDPTFKVVRAWYDSGPRILWMVVESAHGNANDVKGLIAQILTEDGCIAAQGFSRKNQWKVQQPVIKQMILSIDPVPAIKYKPGWSTDATEKKDLDEDMDTLIEITSFITVAVLIWYFRRRFKKEREK